ncbi:hypothetical protein ZIOFF_040906 [Zingiber officinale]|uniref:Uncharacterized protein n=1 Tax=Zingiber officinale TaxID=94328 RepID=A0A8J5L4X8_ZINOF|nr:hypothetical protein ZIOFF_040906 [Zingiber officinale]
MITRDRKGKEREDPPNFYVGGNPIAMAPDIRAGLKGRRRRFFPSFSSPTLLPAPRSLQIPFLLLFSSLPTPLPLLAESFPMTPRSTALLLADSSPRRLLLLRLFSPPTLLSIDPSPLNLLPVDSSPTIAPLIVFS